MDNSSEFFEVERRGAVAILTLNRPDKRNALNDRCIEDLTRLFSSIEDGIKAVVVCGAGEHFCAGLDLSELSERSTAAGIQHSMMWHRAFAQIQFGAVPVIAVLHGAVVGGGLELACAAHLRVAERSAFYALPEAQRGIYVGGGGSARLPRIIGVPRMTDMMLTGRIYDAAEGDRIGLTHYLVDPGEGLEKGIVLAERVAENAPLTNFAVMHALPRIADVGQEQGLLTEALMAAIAQGDAEAKDRMQAFLEKRGPKVGEDG